MDRWPLWAGDAVGKPNAYVNQILSVMASFTGVTPPFRIGGNTEDLGYIQPGVAVINASFPEPTVSVPFPEAKIVGIGNDFYALSSNLPKGTKFIWGINLKVRNVTETVAQAALLADTFQGSRKQLMSNVTLDAIEVGNQVDVYGFPGWSPKSFVELYHSTVQGMMDVIQMGGKDEPKLEAAAITSFTPGQWNIGTLLNAGIHTGKAGKLLGVYGQHHYSGVHAYPGRIQPVPGDLMNKDNIRGNLTRHAKDIVRARSVGLPYIMSEYNSYSNHGAPGVSNTAEAAIWMVDNSLQAASVGVQAIHFHHGIGFTYNLIQPVSGADDGVGLTSRPHILPSFNGALVVNEAIGSSGQSCVAEIGTNSANLSAYGIWEKDTLARVVIINSDQYLPSHNASAQRTTSSVNLDGLDHKGRITAKRLFIPSTNATTGLTWASVNYDTASGVPEGTPEEEEVTGSSLTVSASEVVMLCLK